MKKQVFGGVLFCLGLVTAWLSGVIGFELDAFYVVISVVGVFLFLYGTLQRQPGGMESRENTDVAHSRTGLKG